MATKNISKMSAVLTADAGPYVKGVKQAEKATETMASRVAGTVGKMAKIMAPGGAMFAAIGGGKQGLAGILSPSSLQSSSNPFISAIGTAFQTLGQGVTDILAADQQARRLGVTITELRTVMLSAGAASESMGEALGAFGNRLAMAQMGSVEAARDFARLGALSGRGFSVQGQTTATGYRAMLEQLAAIPNASRRAAIAFDLLGSKAIDLLPELDKGTAGLDRAQRIIERFGMGVGSKDVANVRQVAQTMKEFETLKLGVLNQFTLALSPIISELANVFDVSKLNISGWRSAIVDAAEAVAKAGAFVVEAWSNTKLITQAWDVVALHVKAVMLEIVSTVQSKMAATMAGSVWTSGQASALSTQSSISAAEAETARFKAAIAAMKLSDNLSGTTSYQNVLEFFKKIRERSGGTQTTAPGTQTPAAIAQLMGQFGTMTGAVKSPLEAFRESINTIGQFNGLGKFAGDPSLRGRMLYDAFTKLRSGVNLPDLQSPSAALFNTREAYSATVQHQRGDRRMTVQEEMKALLKEANRFQEAQQRIGEDILAELKGSGLVKVRGQ